MKLTKEDINKIANEMSECTFDENGFIVEDNKKESETMKNQKTDKIVMNKATWTIFYSLIRDKVNEARVRMLEGMLLNFIKNITTQQMKHINQFQSLKGILLGSHKLQVTI